MNDPIYDEPGFQIGTAQPLRPEIKVVYGEDALPGEKHHGFEFDIGSILMDNVNSPYKYAEDRIIADFHDYIDNTYSQHYQTENNVQCFDAWIALEDATPTFRNTAMKYLWRYGKKNGNNKDDLMKVLHYTIMCLYNDHYKDVK
jgi:hypothetical protein